MLCEAVEERRAQVPVKDSASNSKTHSIWVTFGDGDGDSEAIETIEGTHPIDPLQEETFEDWYGGKYFIIDEGLILK